MPSSEPPVPMVVALHCGTVIYGNIAAAARLDFTVIGPAVNLVSRVEALAKALDLPIVVSEAFARAYGGKLRSLGRHELRGLAGSHELYAPEPPPVLLGDVAKHAF
jgi:adenylate cyclase